MVSSEKVSLSIEMAPHFRMIITNYVKAMSK